MSEKMTRIRLPGQKDFSGLLEWGEKSADEMIASARRYADNIRAELAALDSASDEEFQIDVVRGPCVQRHCFEVQKAKASEEAA